MILYYYINCIENKRTVKNVVAKIDKWTNEEGLTLIEGWARMGLTDQQISHNMGISRKTLAEWKKKHEDIEKAIARGKEVVDIEVENSLLQKALGIATKVKKPIKVKTVEYKDGKRVKEVEHIEYADEEVYIPPDTTAMIFWLKNRKQEKWKNDPQLLELRKQELKIKKEKSENGW